MLRLYTSNDFPEVKHWYCLRGEHNAREEHFPPYGYFWPGVAVGFLYSTDSKLALIEGFITNPEAALRERHKAVLGIAEALVIACKFKKKIPLAFTESNGIRKIAKRVGLQSAGLFEAFTLGE